METPIRVKPKATHVEHHVLQLRLALQPLDPLKRCARCPAPSICEPSSPGTASKERSSLGIWCTFPCSVTEGARQGGGMRGRKRERERETERKGEQVRKGARGRKESQITRHKTNNNRNGSKEGEPNQDKQTRQAHHNVHRAVVFAQWLWPKHPHTAQTHTHFRHSQTNCNQTNQKWLPRLADR